MESRNWEVYYRKLLTDHNIPFQSYEEITKDEAEICGLAVNLADVMKRIPETCKKIRIFADVLIVPYGYTCHIKKGYLYLFARVIQMQEKSRFLVDDEENQHTTFMAYYRKTEGKAEIIFSGRKEGSRTKEVRLLNQEQKDYVGIKYQRKDERIQETKVMEVPQISGPVREKLELLAAAQLEAAFLISYTERELAIDLLHWILVLMKNSDMHKQLYVQTYAYRNVLSAKNQAYIYVPMLDKEQYHKQAEGYLDILEKYESAYLRFRDRAADRKERRESVQLMYDLQENAKNYAQISLSTAKEDYEAALDSYKQAAFNFQLQQDYLSYLQKQFEIDFSYWCSLQKIEAAVEILKGIFSLGISVITLVVGVVALGPAGGAAAGGTASAGAGTANAVQKHKKLLEQIQKIVDEAVNPEQSKQAKLKENWEKVTDTLEKLTDCLDHLERLYQNSVCLSNIHADAGMTDALDFTDVSKPREQSLYWWDIYEQDVLLNLSQYQKMGAPGIDNLVTEYKKYMIYGKAALRAKEAAVQKGQEYGSLVMESSRMAENGHRIMQEYERLTDEEMETEKLQMYFSEQMTNMKHWICIVMENYSAAYEYWTLQKFPLPIVPTKDAAGLKEDLLRVYENWQKVLEGLNPPPQEFQKLSVTFQKGRDKEFEMLAKDLKEKHQMQVPIMEDSSIFTGHSRVRLDTVRLWLRGAEKEGIPVISEISTSGDHADRLGKTWNFSMEPFRRKFQYIKQSDGSVHIQKDGRISREFAGWYAQPTPFTQWTISLMTPDAVSFDTLEEIALEFEGSSI